MGIQTLLQHYEPHDLQSHVYEFTPPVVQTIQVTLFRNKSYNATSDMWHLSVVIKFGCVLLCFSLLEYGCVVLCMLIRTSVWLCILAFYCIFEYGCVSQYATLYQSLVEQLYLSLIVYFSKLLCTQTELCILVCPPVFKCG